MMATSDGAACDPKICDKHSAFEAKFEYRNSSTHQIRQLVNVFTRLHPFVVNSALGFTTSQRRQFCRDVYDYARGAGFSKPQARQEVIKARTICGEIDYESDDSSLEEEVDDTAEVMDSLSMRPQTHGDTKMTRLKPKRLTTRRRSTYFPSPKMDSDLENPVPRKKKKLKRERTATVSEPASPTSPLMISWNSNRAEISTNKSCSKNQQRQPKDDYEASHLMIMDNVGAKSDKRKKKRKKKKKRKDKEGNFSSIYFDNAVEGLEKKGHEEILPDGYNLQDQTFTQDEATTGDILGGDLLDKTGACECTASDGPEPQLRHRKERSERVHQHTVNLVAQDKRVGGWNSQGELLNIAGAGSIPVRIGAVPSDADAGTAPLLTPSITRLLKSLPQSTKPASYPSGTDASLGQDRQYDYSASTSLIEKDGQFKTNVKAKASTKRRSPSMRVTPDTKIHVSRSAISVTKAKAQSRKEESENRKQWFAEVLQQRKDESSTRKHESDGKPLRQSICTVFDGPSDLDEREQATAGMIRKRKYNRFAKESKIGTDEEHQGSRSLLDDRPSPESNHRDWMCDEPLKLPKESEMKQTATPPDTPVKATRIGKEKYRNKIKTAPTESRSQIPKQKVHSGTMVVTGNEPARSKSPSKKIKHFQGTIENQDHIWECPVRDQGFLDSDDSDSMTAPDEGVSKTKTEQRESQQNIAWHKERTPPAPPRILGSTVESSQSSITSPKTLFIQQTLATSSPRRKTTATGSPFFDALDIQKVSCLKFPSLHSIHFGLVQERLSDQPFRLLAALIFLNKTRGSVAIPICEKLFELYPSAQDFSMADPNDILSIIHPLGLQNKRAQLLIDLAKAWVEDPPRVGKRYRRLHYPAQNDGRDIATSDQPISDEDDRAAWEVAHLPGVGVYTLDSWRIFCRDSLRGVPTGLRRLGNLEGIQQELQQEWCKVLPKDKELRAYLKWRWLRLGFLWNPLDGEKIAVSKDIVEKLAAGKLWSYGGFKNPWLVDLLAQDDPCRPLTQIPNANEADIGQRMLTASDEDEDNSSILTSVASETPEVPDGLDVEDSSCAKDNAPRVYEDSDDEAIEHAINFLKEDSKVLGLDSG